MTADPIAPLQCLTEWPPLRIIAVALWTAALSNGPPIGRRRHHDPLV